MRNLKALLFLTNFILSTLGTTVGVFAQSNVIPDKSDNSQKNENDSFLSKLPSLESLIDSALFHAPMLKMQSLDLRIKDMEINNARKNWSKNIISGNASYNYGDNLILSENLGLGQLSTNSKADSHYSVGFSLKIPITTLFDHQDLRKAEIELQKTEMQRLILVKSIREEVNTKYLNLTNAYQKYKILLDDFESHEINLQNAEKDFLNSRISVQEVTTIKMANSKAKLELTDAKSALSSAIWLLEELVGFQLKL
jgi:outer membrane protein